MWICQNCSAEFKVEAERCPTCGAVLSGVTGSGREEGVSTLPEDAPTEFDVANLSDLGPGIVECYIGVTASEASEVADRLRDAGIPAYVQFDRSESGDQHTHRVRVPMVELGRSLVVIDQLQKQRPARS